MRFNVTTVPDETELSELSFSKAAIAALKVTDYITVNDLLHAFENRTVFSLITDKAALYDIALTICNPKLTRTYKTARFAFLDDDSAAEDQLNASFLMLSEEARRVLRRFEITVPAQLGYVLTEEENHALLDAVYERDLKAYELLDRMLVDIGDVYPLSPANYEVNIRGQYASETFSLEIKDVFKGAEFKKFRQYCDDVGAIWIKNLTGFSPNILRECIGANQNLIDLVTQRCKQIEQGNAFKYAGSQVKSRKSKPNSMAREFAVERHRNVSSDTLSRSDLYGENEIVHYVFSEPICPPYMLAGFPVAFSYCNDAVMCSSWEDLLVKVLRFLSAECPEKIEKLIGAQKQNQFPAFLYRFSQVDKVSCPQKITPLLIAETDYSSEEMLSIIKYATEKCRIPAHEFSIACFCPLKSIIEYYSEDNGIHSASDGETSEDPRKSAIYDDAFSERRKAFEQWLGAEKGYSRAEIQECIASIHIAGDWALKLGLCQTGLFKISNTYSLVKCCEALLADRDFTNYVKTTNDCDFYAIDQLIEFCIDSDTYEAADEDTTEDNEECDNFSELPPACTVSGTRRKKRFAKWLADGKKLNAAKIETYTAAINTASAWARKLSITAKNFFNIDDIGELVRITDKLLENPQFSKYDTSMNMRYTNVIDLLVDYYYENE